ncbi:MAG TPA: extracellular solute-binding protein [Candidatus Paceibacterota bacterium]
MSTFQIIILSVFLFFLFFAVLVFAGVIPFFGGAPSGVAGTVTMWGTVPESFLDDGLLALNKVNEGSFSITYVEKRKEGFDRDLVEALASGRGPDMILLPENLIVRHSDKVFPLPLESFSIRKFRDTFIEEGELYLTNSGILALPFSVDPMVLFWNRDIFNSASVSVPPNSWDQFLTLAPRLTQKDQALTIHKSAIALGEFGNVTHAKDVLAMLMLQAGDSIVERGDEGLAAILGEQRGLITPPAESALRFFTEFSNPAKTTYSWNRSLPDSKDFFIANDLAAYIGFASEIGEIRARSPHLNFDITSMPQPREVLRAGTLGRMMGIAVLKTSQNIGTAFYASSILTGPEFLQAFAIESGLPSVRRDILSIKNPGPFGDVLNASALMAHGWLDPSPEASVSIFRTMVDAVVSGKEKMSQAVARANGELGNLLKAQ